MITVTNTCPPLEDIAAFLDGKLSEGERARVVAHLADCESCYAVFAGAARFQLAEEEESRAPEATEDKALAPAVPLRRRTILRWALPVAAVLVLGLATIPLYQQYNRMPEMTSDELVDLEALASVRTDRLWDDKRGHSESTTLDSRPFETLVGAHLVDLRLNLTRGDRKESLRVLPRINGLIGELLFVDEQAKFYKNAYGELDEGRRTPEELVEEAARIEAELTELHADSPHLAFGKWTEAGRLSALARDPRFFEDSDNRRFPDWLLRNAEEDLDKDVVRILTRIRDTIEDSDPSKLPYDVLAGQFEAILKHYRNEVDAAEAAGSVYSPSTESGEDSPI